MRIAILTQYYPPEVGAPQARLHQLAKHLRDLGHEMTVLTAMPNYPSGVVFEGYRAKALLVEWQDGVRVIRSWVLPSKSMRALPRLACYASFALSCLFGGFKLRGQDLLLVESPPLFLVPSAIVLSRLVGAKMVMNVSDIWPDILVRMGYRMPSILLRTMLTLERIGYRRADAVAVTNPGAAAQLKGRFPGLQVGIVSNGADMDLFSPEKRDAHVRVRLGVDASSFLVAYLGLHGIAQGLITILESAAILRGDQRIRFVLVGDGPEKAALQDQARSLQLRNVTFLNRAPREEIASILASCDVSLVPLAQRLPGTMPSKVYEALASGIPVIVTEGCEAEALVRENDVGATYAPGDAEDLTRAILGMVDKRQSSREIGQRCRQLARRFDRGRIARHTNEFLLAVYQDRPLPEPAW